MMKVASILVCALTLVLGTEIELNENGCPTDYSIEQLYPHTECDKYYLCYLGERVEYQCEVGLFFNTITEICELSVNVECGDRIIPDSDDNDGDSDNDGDDGTVDDGNDVGSDENDDDTNIGGDNDNNDEDDNNGENEDAGNGGGDDGNEIGGDDENDDNTSVEGDNGSNEDDTNGDNGDNAGVDDDNDDSGNGDNDDSGNGDNDDGDDGGNDDGNGENGDNGGVDVEDDNGDSGNGENDDGGDDGGNDDDDDGENGDNGGVDGDDDNDDGGDEGGNDGGDGNGENEDTDNGDNDSDGNGDNESGDNDDSESINDNPAEAPEICARIGSEGLFVAHENCTQFYRCFNRKPVAFTCPSTLLYNPKTEQCDWPKQVDCGDRIIPEPDVNDDDSEGDDDDDENAVTEDSGPGNDNPAEAPEICARAGSEGVLVAHENCTQFYQCFNGKPVALKCPGILVYNPRIEQCDWQRNVDCGDRVIPEPEPESDDDDEGDDDDDEDAVTEDSGPGNDNPAEAPALCASIGSDGVYVAHENCTQFYQCFNGKPIALQCPRGLLYNPKTEQCDWPENVDCGERIIPEPEDIDSDEDKDSDEEEEEDTGPGNDDPAEAPALCASLGSDGVYVAHEYCTQFYQCFNGKPIAMKCPGTLLYNPRTERCDWAQNVDCGVRTIPEPEENDDDSDENNSETEEEEDSGPGNDNPAEAPEICAQDESDGVLVAHENCTQFYLCFNDKPIAMKCAGNLLYNPRIEKCDWPQNVDCGDRIIPEPEPESDDDDEGDDNDEDAVTEDSGPIHDNPAEAPEICADDESNGVLVANENCTQFYQCFDGKPVSFMCPDGLLYNPIIGQCDWPQNVDCGDRIIPLPDDSESGDEGDDEDNESGGNGDDVQEDDDTDSGDNDDDGANEDNGDGNNDDDGANEDNEDGNNDEEGANEDNGDGNNGDDGDDDNEGENEGDGNGIQDGDDNDDDVGDNEGENGDNNQDGDDAGDVDGDDAEGVNEDDNDEGGNGDNTPDTDDNNGNAADDN